MPDTATTEADAEPNRRNVNSCAALCLHNRQPAQRPVSSFSGLLAGRTDFCQFLFLCRGGFIRRGLRFPTGWAGDRGTRFRGRRVSAGAVQTEPDRAADCLE
jgi:hypothetical protein